LRESAGQFGGLGCLSQRVHASAHACHVDVRVEREQRDGVLDVHRTSGDRLEDHEVRDARHRHGGLAEASRGPGSECFVLEGRPTQR
jgi:hypothetical protein